MKNKTSHCFEANWCFHFAVKFRHQEKGDKDDLSPRSPSVVPRLISETATGIVEIEKCHWSSAVILPGSYFRVTEKLSKNETKLNENVQSGNGGPWVVGLLF